MEDDNETSQETPAGDYEVGYRKPPKHTRFKPGQSGNPRGRPKGTKNLRTDLMEELGEKIVIREGDRSRTVSKQRAVVKSLVTRTLRGDARAANLLTSMMMRLLDTGDESADATEPLLEEEQEILRAFEARARRTGSQDVSAPIDRHDDPEDSS